MKVKLVWITPDAESVIAYCARVSNQANQNNPDIEKLLRYCVREKHWSIFEMANACFEIETSRAITAQIARHRSFSFQEFSQRYAQVQSFEEASVRRQDAKNRQSSIDDLPDDVKAWWSREYQALTEKACELYGEAVAKGVAKECARMVLPMATRSRMYMNGTIRSWIHYLALRTDAGTQKEHRDVACKIRSLLSQQLPVIARAMEWTPAGAQP
jgi:thymidylate synthase (FAD)